MKQLYLKSIILGILSIICITASAYNCEVDGIYYYLDQTGKTAIVTKGSANYSGAVTIPSTINYDGTTYSVTSIGSSAFSVCTGLTFIEIPSSVTSIGSSAFDHCFGLTSIKIPKSVTSIGSRAFEECLNLSIIEFPDNLICIEWGAFIGTAWFNNQPDGIVYAGKVVYSYKGDMPANTKITLLKGTKGISNGAFSGCSGLTSIEIPSSVTSIGSGAFYECSGLEKVIVKDIAAWCNISFAESANPLSYANHLYSDDYTEIKALIIPNVVTSVGSYTFLGCSGLTSIEIPSSVTSIGNSAFSGCSGLTSIEIPSSVISIENNAFSDCSGLKKVIVKDIAAWCNISFTESANPLSYAHHLYSDDYTEIKALIIPNAVTSIGSYAFSGCSDLTSVTIPSSVTSIGSYAFFRCSRLTTIYSLNPLPPYCSGLFTFYCGSDVRDRYDVYTYATLHVPMGSEESYSSAYEWRYFNKIKEDMESNGNVYYANLTVKQGTIGYTRQAVKADARHTIYIGSLGENKVNTVTFNGIDVTDEVVNGYYTTPEIKGESVLSISFETNSSVKSLSLNNLKVMGYDGEIQIMNIDEPSDVFVYTVNGKLVGNLPSAYGSASIQVASEELYVVKVGSRVFKVAL